MHQRQSQHHSSWKSTQSNVHLDWGWSCRCSDQKQWSGLKPNSAAYWKIVENQEHVPQLNWSHRLMFYQPCLICCIHQKKKSLQCSTRTISWFTIWIYGTMSSKISIQSLKTIMVPGFLDAIIFIAELTSSGVKQVSPREIKGVIFSRKPDSWLTLCLMRMSNASATNPAKKKFIQKKQTILQNPRESPLFCPNCSRGYLCITVEIHSFKGNLSGQRPVP